MSIGAASSSSQPPRQCRARADRSPPARDSHPFLSAARTQYVVDLQKLGYVEEEFFVIWQWPLPYRCDPDVPLMESTIMRDAVNAAFANLDRWVRTGTPAPRAERIAVADGGTPQARFVTDRLGNATGGVRSPFLDVPTATYTTARSGPMTCRSLGFKTPFDWARLETIYRTSREYAGRFAASVDALVRSRWLTESDGRRLKAESLAQRIDK